MLLSFRLIYIIMQHSYINKILLYLSFVVYQINRVVRKPAFCICENKDADQLRDNREADQRLCFRYIDSITRLLSIYELSGL